jgi:Flp pilus assembly protein TadG
MKPIPKSHRSSSGQALIEFALILPVLFLLIVNVVNFGGMLYAWITLSNSARAGAQVMVVGGAYLTGPAYPDQATVRSFTLNDLQSLPNSSTLLKVTVCWRSPSSSALSTPPVLTCTGDQAGTVSPPIDTGTEASYYIMGSVDVEYTYTPLIPLWDFPKLGIHATLPPTRIHRQAAMRLL